MPLISMQTMLAQALEGGYGVGYFEAWDAYSLEAVLEAAEEEQAPVILGFGGMMASSEWLDNGGVELLGAMGRTVAARSRVPVSLIFNEAQTLDQMIRGLDAGFNAVMLDTSAWAIEEATEAVAELARIAHARGATVEAELGRLPDATAEGIDDSTAFLTDPVQAAAFVEATGADCLAVSIGNIHLLTTHEAPTNAALLEEIHCRVSVPLVIHGGTSFPAQAIPHAIANGVAKFNVGTILKTVFLQAVREEMASWGAQVNVHDLLGSHKDSDMMTVGKNAVKAKTRALIRLYGGSRRAQ